MSRTGHFSGGSTVIRIWPSAGKSSRRVGALGAWAQTWAHNQEKLAAMADREARRAAASPRPKRPVALVEGSASTYQGSGAIRSDTK